MTSHGKNSLYIFLLSFSLFLGLCLQAYHAGNMRLFNFGFFHHVIWNSLHGNFFWSSFHNCNGLGIHFQLIFLSIAPLYYFFQSGYCLLIFQALLFSIATIGVYHLAFAILDNEKEAMLWGILSAIFPPLVANCASGIQDVHFCLPIALWLLYFLERRRYLPVYLLAFLMFLVKEEMFLWGVFLGLYLIIFHKKRLPGALIALGSLLLFVVMEFSIMPSIIKGQVITHHFFKYSFGHFGRNPGEMIANLPSHWHYLFIPPRLSEKVLHIITLLAFFLFLPLRRPRYLFLVIPSFCLYYISQRDLELSPKLYYVMTIMPYLFASAMSSFSMLTHREKKGIFIGLFIVALLFDYHYYKSDFLSKDYASNKAVLDSVVRSLPPDAGVSVDEFTGGYEVVKRKKVQLFRFFFARPQLYNDYEFILLNIKYCRTGLPEPIAIEELGFLDQILRKGEYKAVFFQDDVLLLRKAPQLIPQ
jgi:uncharacterized membrane protein